MKDLATAPRFTMAHKPFKGRISDHDHLQLTCEVCGEYRDVVVYETDGWYPAYGAFCLDCNMISQAEQSSLLALEVNLRRTVTSNPSERGG